MTVQVFPQRQSCPVCRAVYLSDLSYCPNDGNKLLRLPVDPLVGATVGEYIVESVLADGGMGRVYRARTTTGVMVALKVLYGELAALATSQDRFAREVEIAGLVVHPNVVPVIDFGRTESGLPFLVSPYVEGRLLSSVVDKDAPMAAVRACRILRSICDGVAAIHKAGVIHRDLKASNILVCGPHGEERVKIFDFGIALAADDEDHSRLTRSDKIVGTASYMAPERITADDRVDLRADLFSLGVLFYRMLSGVFPYQGSPLLRVLKGAVSSPPLMGQRTPGYRVHAGAEAIAMRLLQRNPEDRYKDAAEVTAAIDALQLVSVAS